MNDMYVVYAKDPDTFSDLHDRFLIIPTQHIEEPEDLPLGWGETLVELTRAAGLQDNFNWSLNKGLGAGQTLSHLHWWALDRRTDNINKGMSWMIQRILELEKSEAALQQQVVTRESELSQLKAANTELRRHGNLQLNG